MAINLCLNPDDLSVCQNNTDTLSNEAGIGIIGMTTPIERLSSFQSRVFVIDALS